MGKAARKSWFRKKTDSPLNVHCEADLEKITDRLLDETFGENGIITKTFEERLKSYSKEENPISPEEAEALIHSLLRLAVAQRKCIPERIAASVESGDLFQRYYGKLHLISDSAVDAYTKMVQMESAKADYEYEAELLKNVREQAYQSHVKPQKRTFISRRRKDVLEAIDEAAEGKEAQ